MLLILTIGAARRRPRCLVAIRDPVERFLSYYVMRTDKSVEKVYGRPFAEWTVKELEDYLDLVSPEGLVYDGTESGLYGTAEGYVLSNSELEA